LCDVVTSKDVQGRIQGGEAIGAIAPPKTYEGNFFYHDFVEFGKTVDCQLKLDYQILLKLPPLNLRAGSATEDVLHFDFIDALG